MQADLKIDVAMVNSMGDPLHNVMHTMGTNSVMGWNTVHYTSNMVQAQTSTDACVIYLHCQNQLISPYKVMQYECSVYADILIEILLACC